jgi:formate hydrogenlyase subunit 4
MTAIIGIVAFVVLGPIIGGLLAGVDRILTARMQARKGPPLLQPFYDVGKLWEKQGTVVSRYQTLYIWCFLAFVVIGGAVFFSGGDLLVCVFALTVAGVFLTIAAQSCNSPYSNIGASRELLQMMSYEPMLIIAVLGFYMVMGSFRVGDIVQSDKITLAYLPGVFIGFLFILTIKLRKSPFDLSSSHHGHQELVKGVTTDISGRDLAVFEIAHLYENTIILGLIYLFFSWMPWWAAVPLSLMIYFLEVYIDNTHARLKWQQTVRSSWIVAGTFGALNLLVLGILFYYR